VPLTGALSLLAPRPQAPRVVTRPRPTPGPRWPIDQEIDRRALELNPRTLSYDIPRTDSKLIPREIEEHEERDLGEPLRYVEPSDSEDDDDPFAGQPRLWHKAWCHTSNRTYYYDLLTREVSWIEPLEYDTTGLPGPPCAIIEPDVIEAENKSMLGCGPPRNWVTLTQPKSSRARAIIKQIDVCGAYIGLAFDDGRVELWAWFGDLVFGGLLEATYVVRRCLKHSLESTDVEDSKSYATVDYTDPIKSIVDGLVARVSEKPERRVRSRIYDDSDSSDDDSDEQVQLLPRDFEATHIKMRPGTVVGEDTSVDFETGEPTTRRGPAASADAPDCVIAAYHCQKHGVVFSCWRVREGIKGARWPRLSRKFPFTETHAIAVSNKDVAAAVIGGEGLVDGESVSALYLIDGVGTRDFKLLRLDSAEGDDRDARWALAFAGSSLVAMPCTNAAVVFSGDQSWVRERRVVFGDDLYPQLPFVAPSMNIGSRVAMVIR
jgi:hypothetical protein